MSFEVIFKHNEDIVLTIHNLINKTSTMEAIKTHRDRGLAFDTADIFETQGRLRYLVNREKFHK